MTLEELLNKLIEKGWKPFGYENVYIETYDESTPHGYVILRGKKYGTYEVIQDFRPYRFICMIESGLWQFCVENGMVKEQKEEKLIEIYDNLRGRTEVVYDDGQCQYRLIESALKDESELEEFLLSNIKIGK